MRRLCREEVSSRLLVRMGHAKAMHQVRKAKAMTEAKVIAERFVARKAKCVTANGETVYTVSVEELAALITAVQKDARKRAGK